MTTVIIYQFNVYCTIDNAYYQTWSDIVPTRCPKHGDTNIDTTKTWISAEINQNAVFIQQEQVPTNGNFQASSLTMNMSGGTPGLITSSDLTFDFPINVIFARFIITDTHENDFLDVTINPNTIVGVITTDASVGSNFFNVNSTVYQNAQVSMRITLTDGVNTDFLGTCINVDQVGGTITTKYRTTHAFSAGSPTYVMITAIFANQLDLGPPGDYTYGQTKISGAYVPTGTVIHFDYTNNTSNSKSLKFLFDYLV